MRVKVEISPENIDKMLEMTGDFFKSIGGHAASEFGLLMGDKVRYYRVKNQLKILIRTKKLIEKYQISPKVIPIKILVPLLENASLEDDETLQDLWSNLLLNMVDAEENYQNHVFPSVLSQISIEDYEELKSLIREEDQLEADELAYLKNRDELKFGDRWDNEKKLFNSIENRKQYGFSVSSPECDNLIRLGLIKRMPPEIYIPEFKTGGDHVPANMGGSTTEERWHNINAEYAESNDSFRITELGKMLFMACSNNK